MADSAPNRKPLFTTGDHVQVVGPTMHRFKQGVVVEVVQPSIDLIYRYRVRFSDETVATFFGFELNVDSSGKVSGTAEG